MRGPGAALRREEPRGRTAVLGLGALNLFVLPFGTALSIYAYWVLLHNETRGVFVGRRADPERTCQSRENVERAGSERRRGALLQPWLGHRRCCSI